jgi:ATP-dependent Lon protease
MPNFDSVLVERSVFPDKTEEVPALFSREVVMFPRMQVSLVLGEEKGTGAVGQALSRNHLVAFIPSDFEKQREGIGVLTLVLESETTPKGLRVDLRGLWRVKVSDKVSLSAGSLVKVERAEESDTSVISESASLKRVHAQIAEFKELIPDIPEEITTLLEGAKTASELSDLCAMSPTLTHDERVKLLLTLDAEDRLDMLSKHFDRELETLRTMVEGKPIPECEICADLADRAFDSDPNGRAEAIVELLNHIVSNHTTELLTLLSEKYGAAFVSKRSLR